VESERRALAKIAAGAPLSEVFNELMRAIEARSDVAMLASVLLLDKEGKRLLHGAAPSLPRSYNSAIHGLRIGPAMGSCGTAAFRGEPVLVEDIATHPLWIGFRDLAMSHGLRACWSTPIKGTSGKVLGTFALYYREPRKPTRHDLESISLVAHTAAVAIERYNAELALRESQERLSHALNAAGVVGTWDWRVATNILYCDARLATLMSLEPSKKGAPISKIPAAIHADDVARVKAAIEHSIATGNRFSQECRLVQKDGSVRWVTARGECHYNRQGRPLRFAGAVVDITDRKRTEAALAESEACLEQALAAGEVIAFEWDCRTGFSKYSRNTSQVLGFEPYSGSNARRNDFLARVHADDRERFKAHVYGTCPSRPSYVVDFRLIRPDGQEIWLEETAKAEFDDAGRLVRLKGLTRNATERRRAEQHQRLLVAELDHRVKNALACVSVVAQHTRKGCSTIDEFLQVFDGRVQSIANAHALLSRGRWQGVSLADLIHGELAPCMGEENVAVRGPHIVLAVEATQALAMVFHELVTNAAKYGALSTPHGRVTVRWNWLIAETSLLIEWEEIGGPTVKTPRRIGYGTSVIRDVIPYELGGTADLVLATEGVRCRLEIPKQWTSGCERSDAAVSRACGPPGVASCVQRNVTLTQPGEG